MCSPERGKREEERRDRESARAWQQADAPTGDHAQPFLLHFSVSSGLDLGHPCSHARCFFICVLKGICAHQKDRGKARGESTTSQGEWPDCHHFSISPSFRDSGQVHTYDVVDRVGSGCFNHQAVALAHPRVFSSQWGWDENRGRPCGTQLPVHTPTSVLWGWPYVKKF